jgi:hypothetical protein
MTKILTDPFHDIMLYYKAPFHLVRGELIDPMRHVEHGQEHPLDGEFDDDLEPQQKHG